MRTIEATVRSVSAHPNIAGALLISFFELAAYYRADGALAEQLRALTPGTRLCFTHDIECRIDSVAAYH